MNRHRATQTSQGITHRAVSNFNTIGIIIRAGRSNNALVNCCGETKGLDNRTRFKRNHGCAVHKHRPIFLLGKIRWIISRIIRHCQNLTVFRIHNNHTSLGGASCFNSLFQRQFSLVLNIPIHRQRQIVARFRLDSHIIFSNRQRYIPHVSYRLQQSITTLKLLIQRAFDAILTFASRIHKSKHVRAQFAFRIISNRTLLIQHACKVFLFQFFRLSSGNIFRQNFIARLFIIEPFRYIFRHFTASNFSQTINKLAPLFIINRLRVRNHRINRLIKHHRNWRFSVHHINFPALRRNDKLTLLTRPR